jgi:hypothetical protein
LKEKNLNYQYSLPLLLSAALLAPVPPAATAAPLRPAIIAIKLVITAPTATPSVLETLTHHLTPLFTPFLHLLYCILQLLILLNGQYTFDLSENFRLGDRSLCYQSRYTVRDLLNLFDISRDNRCLHLFVQFAHKLPVRPGLDVFNLFQRGYLIFCQLEMFCPRQQHSYGIASAAAPFASTATTHTGAPYASIKPAAPANTPSGSAGTITLLIGTLELTVVIIRCHRLIRRNCNLSKERHRKNHQTHNHNFSNFLSHRYSLSKTN